jgi:hypothetical protein
MKLAILTLTLLLSMTAFPQTETRCEIYAFPTTPEHSVFVRSRPDIESPIVKTVKPDPGRTMFDIIGMRGEWLKVSYAFNSKHASVFAGAGWVYAPLLAVKEKRKRYKVFESPSATSKRIDVSLFDHILPLAGCDGEWAKVQLPVTGTGVSDKKKTGWMPQGTYCGNPWIECDY